MTEPKLILLDEPMAGVNPTLARSCWSTCRRCGRSAGVTFLLVEHDLDLVMRACDTVVVMNEGRILTARDPGRSAASTSGSSTRTWARTHDGAAAPRWSGSRPATSR